jgi:uncharacterized protein (TIGR02145 family)
VSPTSGSGNGAVNVNVAENAASVTRCATLTIAAGAVTRTVAVAQAAKPAPPQYAASAQIWTIGEQTWSAAIQIPACNKTSFTYSDTVPDCHSYTSGTNTWYYYNWTYVELNAAQLCPSPWRVPAYTDFCTLDKNITGASACPTRVESFGPFETDKYENLWGCDWGGTGLGEVGKMVYYWSSTQHKHKYAFGTYMRKRTSVAPVVSYLKNNRAEIRCVTETGTY